MNDPLRPDEIIDPAIPAATQAFRLLRDTVGMLPNLLKLLARLLRDPRVPRRSKLAVGLALAYVVSPFDVLPEFVPVVGFADDLLLVAASVNHLIKVAGSEVVLEHWDGPRDLLEMVEAILETAAELVPSRVRRIVARLAGD